MASAKITVSSKGAKSERVEMVIVGAGICGIIAAKNCFDRQLSYKLIDKNPVVGGNWYSLANSYSHLQAYEPNYRWHEDYKLSEEPLTKNSGARVLDTLQEFAKDHGMLQNALLNTEVVDVYPNDDEKQGKYRVVCKNIKTGAERHIYANFLCVTAGILKTQWSAEDRGVKDVNKFKGIVTRAGKHEGVDCAAGTTDLTGKHVVILGSGSFASEAMEAADRNNAQHITIIGRQRYRLLLPFSRQYTISAIASCPFLPWSIKYRFAMWYVKRCFYDPCNLSHWYPEGEPHEIDYAGQCNDATFRLAYEGRLTCKIGKLDRMEASAAVLEGGEKIPCDMLVVASGCQYNLAPTFLKHLDVDNTKLHNFAFLGQNPRIGTASDFVFAYVPFGPMKQMEMYFHAVDCVRRGLEKEATAALEPTPLPNHDDARQAGLKGGRMAGHYTFFEYKHWWNITGSAQQARADSMLRTLDVGKNIFQRIGYRLAATVDQTNTWVKTCFWALTELRRYPVYGPGVGDHYPPQVTARPIIRGAVKAEKKHA